MFHSRVSNRSMLHFLISSEYDIHNGRFNKLKLDLEDFHQINMKFTESYFSV